MARVALLALLLPALVAARSAGIKYKRSSECFAGLGCFSNDAPFFSLYRPVSFLPQSPATIHPKFTVFTRDTSHEGHDITVGYATGLKQSGFSAERDTKFIVHGFIDNGGTDWMAEMKNELLVQGDYNVVLVDWGSGSLNLYGQATANTRVVGAMLAQIINFMTETLDARPEDMHVIGHSLGAHVAGYAGERLKHLGRITGLDPAEPYFQNTETVVRLDPSDALFVDVIHTDGAAFYSTSHGFGMSQACGHVDYYPNGGHKQPGCEDGVITHLVNEGIVTGAKEFVACNHLRAYHFFTESINSLCPFEGYRCDSETKWKNGSCVPCEEGGCGFMGLHADKTKPPRGTTHVKFFLETAPHAPYCRYHFKLTMTFAGTGRAERGEMYVHLTGTTGVTHEVEVTHGATYVDPGHSYTYLLTSPLDLHEIRDVHFRWVHDASVLDFGTWNVFGTRDPTLYMDRVAVTNGETHKSFNFCEHSMAITSDRVEIFSHPCDPTPTTNTF